MRVPMNRVRWMTVLCLSTTVTLSASNPIPPVESSGFWLSESGADAYLATDLNLDGKLELLLTNTIAGTCDITSQNALNPAVLTTLTAPAGFDQMDIIAVDVNGDYLQDVVARSQAANKLLYWKNISKGNQLVLEDPVEIPISGPIMAITSADIDLNGTNELIIAQNEYIRIMRSSAPYELLAECKNSAPVHAIKVADMNGDGKLDMVVASSDGIAVFAKRDAVNGAYGFAAPTAFPINRNVQALEIGDLNGDFIPDVITANYPNNDIAVLTNFSQAQAVTLSEPLFLSTAASSAIRLADLNADGAFDIVGSADGVNWNRSDIFTNTTGGYGVIQFAEEQIVISGQVCGSGDINGDGAEDLLLIEPGKKSLSVWSTAGLVSATVRDAAVYCNEEGNIGIEWKASKLPANTQFRIERTADGIHYEVVEEIAANTSGEYYVAVAQSNAIAAFYRIVTHVAELNLDASTLLSLQPCTDLIGQFNCVINGPVRNEVKFSYTVNEPMTINVAIVREDMEKAKEEISFIQTGNQTQSIPVNELPSGTYFLTVQFANLAPFVYRFDKM